MRGLPFWAFILFALHEVLRHPANAGMWSISLRLDMLRVREDRTAILDDTPRRT